MARDKRDYGLVGNGIALAGAVLYLLEWVAIVVGGVHGAYADGTSDGALLRAAHGNAGFLAFQAGWFSLVLIGRALFVIGVRQALVRSGRPSGLADFAVAAMTMSAVLETTAYAVQAGAAQAHSSAQVLAGLHVATVLEQVIVGPIGISVGALSLAMLGSGLFPKPFAYVGLLIAVLLATAAVLYAPSTAGIADALTGAAFPMYVWMIWIGVRLLRARQRTAPAPTADPSPTARHAVQSAK